MGGAAAGEVARVGWVAGQAGGLHPVGLVADDREGGRQPGRVRVSRLGEDLVARPALDYATRVHHGDPLAHGRQGRQIVGDEDHRQAEALLKILEQLQHLGLDHHVQRGGGLVGDQQLRVAGQREGDQHALTLAPRQLMRIVLRATRGHADEASSSSPTRVPTLTSPLE